MREEVLDRMKIEIKKKEEELIEYNERLSKIKQLENDPRVIEYLSLIKYIENFKLENGQNKDTPFYFEYLKDIKRDETNKIFVYIGTYSYISNYDSKIGKMTDLVLYNSSDADYRKYWDLEQKDVINIAIKNCIQFEKENIIIIPKTDDREKEYYKIQKEFFDEALDKDQEIAKRKILSNYKRL